MGRPASGGKFHRPQLDPMGHVHHTVGYNLSASPWDNFSTRCLRKCYIFYKIMTASVTEFITAYIMEMKGYTNTDYVSKVSYFLRFMLLHHSVFWFTSDMI